jgi:diadenylate cyclase
VIPTPALALPLGASGPVLTPAAVTVLFLAAVLFLLGRALTGTVFGGIVRGLGISLVVACAAAVVAGWLLQSSDLFRVLEILLPAVGVFLVVLFQPEIRRALLRVGRPSTSLTPEAASAVEETVRAVEALAKEKRGALLAWERSVGLGELLATGTVMDAVVSAEAILAVFQPGSPLHDGAVVLRGGRMAAAGCVLPLAASVPPPLGFRHRAALGLAEETDAVCVVVSEESGKVTVAADGRLRTLERPADLRAILAGEAS